MGLELFDWFIILAWIVWDHRNKIVMEDRRVDERNIFQAAELFYQEWLQSNQSPIQAYNISDSVKWKPPPKGFVKVNFDGALDEEIQKAGLGVAIRNEKGELMVALSEQIPTGINAAHVEALAGKEAVILALEAGFQTYC